MKERVFRILVWSKEGEGQRWQRTAQQLGLEGLTACRSARLFFLGGSLSQAEAENISQRLLADPVTELFRIDAPPDLPADHTLEVTLLPGVTDPAAENLLRAAGQLGISSLTQAATGQFYALRGTLEETTLHALATRVFSNPVIQRFALDQPIAAPFVESSSSAGAVEIIPIREGDESALLDLSKTRRLALDLPEMQAIQAYYQQAGREATDLEIEMLAQTWSEHCVHKTFKARVRYSDHGRTMQPIDGLLKTYIRAATEKLAKPWVKSAFVDNAGIIAFLPGWDLAFKVETHNHPSALEPFGGANTGVGGVVRDVLGVSARPIANTDILCFGEPDTPAEKLPAGVLHPRRIAEGVIHGIEDYGNKMGIPTVNGAIFYHPGYTANPLVFCGCLGLLPADSHRSQAQPGDLIIVMGGRTGRDGLRGATFSSMEMDQATGQIAGSAVQIGHPIHEKQVQEVILKARDLGLYHAITDCGAGGLSSAVGEMGQAIGARVELEKVALKYPGLRPWEIWLSEAQERMVLAVAPDQWPTLQQLCEGQNVEAAPIGTFEPSGDLALFYGGQEVGRVAMAFLHEGIPTRNLMALWQAPPPLPLEVPAEIEVAEVILKLLAHPNIRSKEAVIRRYDHEVQGSTAIKPLVGRGNFGPSDGAVLVPLETLGAAATPQGVALTAGICPQYGELDPYAMAWAAIDEAVRNAVALGADPDHIAILDNFCWGNPNLMDRMGSLVRCVQGCHDAALAYGTPFISGKDSLNNEYLGEDGQRHAIPGTLLISAVGLLPNAERAQTMDLKKAGNLLYLVGETRDELGASHFAALQGLAGGQVPQPIREPLPLLRTLHQTIQAGLVEAVHDCAEGGLAVALAEMCIAGGLGARLELMALPLGDDLKTLFSESAGRFVVEVPFEHVQRFERLMIQHPCAMIGRVRDDGILQIYGVSGKQITRLLVADLEKAWRGEPASAAAAATLHEKFAAPAPTRAPLRPPTPRTHPPKVLILHANGTNRDREAAAAFALAGAQSEIVHVNQLASGEKNLLDYQILTVPGGFSYGDDLGAGVLWALDLVGADFEHFIAEGRPVLGICNGFQALVKAGLLPGHESQRSVTLTYNAQGHFECRWVYLKANPSSPCLFTEGLNDLIYCPVAHGEGRIAVRDGEVLEHLQQSGLIALTYVDPNGVAVGYPGNPNGSVAGIAGMCNAAGNVFGLMPHPEDHIFAWQHPRWRRGERGLSGLQIFSNAVKYA